MQAASDVYSPISGEVVESNQGLADEPGKVCTCCLCSTTLAPNTDAALQLWSHKQGHKNGRCLLPVGDRMAMGELHSAAYK